MSGLKLAFISLVRRPVSSLLAVLSLMIPLVAVGILITLLVNSRAGIQTYDTSVDAILGPKSPDLQLVMASLFGVGYEDRLIPHGLLRHAREPMEKKSWTLPDESDGEKIQVVKQATPFQEFAEYDGFKVVGTDDTFLIRPEENMICPEIAAGTWFQTRGQVVLGSTVAKMKNLRPGSFITAQSRLLHPKTGKPLWRKKLTVTGILAPTNVAYDRMLYTSEEEPFDLYRTAIPLNLMRETRNHVGMSYALLWLYDGQEKRLQDFFDNYTVAKTVIVGEQMELMERLFQGGKSFGTFVSGLTVFLGLLCMMVLFNARFEAMGEDLAILRTLGYGKTRIASWLLWESILVWSIALPLALAIEWLLSLSLGYIPGISMLYFDQSWPTTYHLWVWGLMFLACPLTLFIPLIRLHRHNLHNALKGM